MSAHQAASSDASSFLLAAGFFLGGRFLFGSDHEGSPQVKEQVGRRRITDIVSGRHRKRVHVLEIARKVNGSLFSAASSGGAGQRNIRATNGQSINGEAGIPDGAGASCGPKLNANHRPRRAHLRNGKIQGGARNSGVPHFVPSYL